MSLIVSELIIDKTVGRHYMELKPFFRRDYAVAIMRLRSGCSPTSLVNKAFYPAANQSFL